MKTKKKIRYQKTGKIGKGVRSLITVGNPVGLLLVSRYILLSVLTTSYRVVNGELFLHRTFYLC